MTKKAKYYRANQGFATTYDGEPLFVQKGEIVIAGHPLLKGRDELFEPATSLGRFAHLSDVEQATAAPGEKRGEKKPSRRRRSPAKAAPSSPVPAPKQDPAQDPAPKSHFGLQTSDIGERQPPK